MSTRIRPLFPRGMAYMGSSRNAGGTARPAFGLHGVYLQAFGFAPEMWVSGEFTPGCAVFTVLDMTLDLYESFMDGKQPENISLIKIRAYRENGRRFPKLCVSGWCLKLSGFIPEEPVSIEWEQGRVTVKRLEVTT